MTEETKRNSIDLINESTYKIQLVSKDGDSFTVNRDNACISELVKTMINEDDITIIQEIPLPNVSTKVLVKVIEFVNYYSEEKMTTIDKPLKSTTGNMCDIVQEWYAKFVEIDPELLFDLISAANYLNVEPLLALTCATIANAIRTKTPDEVRTAFNIENDFTPLEEEQARAENIWVEEED